VNGLTHDDSPAFVHTRVPDITNECDTVLEWEWYGAGCWWSQQVTKGHEAERTAPRRSLELAGLGYGLPSTKVGCGTGKDFRRGRAVPDVGGGCCCS